MYKERVNFLMYHLSQMFIMHYAACYLQNELQNSSHPKSVSLPIGVDAIKKYFNC